MDPAHLGIILDSSIMVEAERQRLDVTRCLKLPNGARALEEPLRHRHPQPAPLPEDPRTEAHSFLAARSVRR